LWVLDHLNDLESDFWAIHGIRDMWTELTCAQFFRMAERLPAYQGVMATIVEQEVHRRREHFGTAEVIPLTADMTRNPDLAGMIEYSTVEAT
jgi:hypothetical protein